LWVNTPCPVQVLTPSRLSRAGAVPAVSAFEGADPAFASGSPFDGSAERSSSFDLLAGGTGPALARYDDGADTEVGQRGVDGGLAVPAVGGHGPWCTTGPGFDPLDRRRQLWCIGGVSGMHLVIQDDAVVVVDDLPRVAELDGFPHSGVVLSTVREAADLDYRLTVLEDICLDSDDEVHRVLTHKIFPRQAE
jgi:hypothetical protein